MIQLFKRNDIASSIGLIVLTLLTRVHLFLHPPDVQSISDFNQGLFFTWQSLKEFYIHQPVLYLFISTILFLLFAFYFNYVINEEKLYQRKSMLPALALVLYSALVPSLTLFSTVFIANICLFIAFAKSLQLYHSRSSKIASFDIGIWVSAACLFYFPAIPMFIFFLMTLLILRSFSFKEILAYVFGIVTPFYFALGIVFLTGHWHSVMPHLFLHIYLPLKLISNVQFIILTITSLFLIVHSLYLINQSGIKNPIAVQKKWNVIILYLIFSVLIGIFANIFPGLPWLLAITPISIILSQAFHNQKEKYNIFTFYFLLSVIVIVQWLF